MTTAAAQARELTSTREQAAAQAMARLVDEVGDAGRDVSSAGSRVGDAAHWVMDKAKDTLQSAAGQIRERASTGVVTYTKNDPVRAILIAAVTGAILMSLVSMVARSGVRTVRRKIQR